MNTRARALSAHQFLRRIDNGNHCVYCGDRATGSDHFIPVSVVNAIGSLFFSLGDKALVPACCECNSLARNKIFRSVGAKRRYIQKRLRERYAHLLGAGVWTQEELDELGYTLRTVVEAANKQRLHLMERLAWTNKQNPAAAKLAKLSFAPKGFGSGSVPLIAGMPGTRSSCERQESTCKK